MPDQVNIPLLRKAVEWAEIEAAKPPSLSEWEQGFYVLAVHDARLRASKAPECGTCYCIAGWVAAQVTGDPEPIDADVIAQEALGLDNDGADDLFHATNTIADVRRIAEDIAGERL